MSERREFFSRTIKYRSKIDIISTILEAANGGDTTKTKIMYGAFLSYDQLRGYVGILSENGLLDYDSNTRTFKTTEKGLRFLDAYKHMDAMTKE
ncbi:MAG: winged helix-turn-helix domain-containing protein [Thermoproteota archaeon]|nr:winged helix-turn-helix domain-containing protein [Thermoproteota archaeon]